MRAVRNLGIYLIAVFVGGALLAPWLYALAQAAAPGATWIAELADKPFYRYVKRSILLLALMGLWPLLRSLGAGSARALGWAPAEGAASNWTRGFLVGFASLALVASLALLCEYRILKPHYETADILRKLVNAAISGVLVGCLEEFLFRGVMFGGLRRHLPWITALLLSSALYAALHFMEKPATPQTVHWWTGLVVLGQMFEGLTQVRSIVPGFFTLLVAGSILALGYQRTGTLYFSVGLHTGWVFWMKFYGAVTTSLHLEASVVWGSSKLYDGWLSLLTLTAVLAGCMLLLPRNERGSQQTEASPDPRKKLA